jgi:hypothetical protein
VAEGYDPGAEAARKVSPCGNPNVTRTADGFQLDLACEKDHITYALTGTVSGDFVTTANTDLELVVSAFGRKQTLRLQGGQHLSGPLRAGRPATARRAETRPIGAGIRRLRSCGMQDT